MSFFPLISGHAVLVLFASSVGCCPGQDMMRLFMGEFVRGNEMASVLELTRSAWRQE